MPPPTPDSAAFPDWVRGHVDRAALADADKDDFDLLRPFGVPMTFPPGTQLFSSDEPGDRVYLVEAGEVELTEERPFGRRHVIQTVGPGTCVGDLPVMLQLPFSYCAVSRTETRAVCLTMPTIRALVEVSPDVCFMFMRLVSNRLAEAERRLSERGERSALEQVVHLLLNRSDRETAALRMAQRDLAADLGLSRQTVSRVLGELARLRLVEIRRREVRIRDYERLERIRNPAYAHQDDGHAPVQRS